MGKTKTFSGFREALNETEFKRDDIIRKIKSLRNLAADKAASPGEASNAAKLADRLTAKHGIKQGEFSSWGNRSRKSSDYTYRASGAERAQKFRKEKREWDKRVVNNINDVSNPMLSGALTGIAAGALLLKLAHQHLQKKKLLKAHPYAASIGAMMGAAAGMKTGSHFHQKTIPEYGSEQYVKNSKKEFLRAAGFTGSGLIGGAAGMTANVYATHYLKKLLKKRKLRHRKVA